MSRKYVSEFGLNTLGHSVLLQQDGLDKLDQIGLPEDMPLHIYMITRRGSWRLLRLPSVQNGPVRKTVGEKASQ